MAGAEERGGWQGTVLAGRSGVPRAILFKLVSKDLGVTVVGIEHVILGSVCKLPTFF